MRYGSGDQGADRDGTSPTAPAGSASPNGRLGRGLVVDEHDVRKLLQGATVTGVTEYVGGGARDRLELTLTNAAGRPGREATVVIEADRLYLSGREEE